MTDREKDLELGEQYAAESKRFGLLAGKHLFRAQWGYGEPEWYDHRLAWFLPEKHMVDFWAASAHNVIQVTPLNSKMLDLCSGDGFYDYWFYRRRAHVTCIERNQEAYDFALKHYKHPRIKYILDDVLTCELPKEEFDVVVIRGAIEHFSKENQQLIFRRANEALKVGGYFCGDTPAAQGDKKLLGSHEYEWADEWEMIAALEPVFKPAMSVHTYTLESETRTTLFWQCQKGRE